MDELDPSYSCHYGIETAAVTVAVNSAVIGSEQLTDIAVHMIEYWMEPMIHSVLLRVELPLLQILFVPKIIIDTGEHYQNNILESVES